MSKPPEFNPEEFISVSMALMKRAQRLGYIQKGLLAFGYAALIAGILIKFLGGRSSYVTYLALIGTLSCFGSVIIGHIAKPVIAKAHDAAKFISSIMQKTEDGKSAPQAGKIPLAIGFANLSGEDLAEIASEDEAVLSSLFVHSRATNGNQIPSAEILFVYAHLNEDGTIKGPAHSEIRQVAQIAKASIVILASPNSASSIQNAAALPGPKTANIVLTLHRNGRGFSQFFRELFEKMRDGKDMLSAWVEISPQHPNASPAYAPQTVLMAEGGKIAFPG